MEVLTTIDELKRWRKGKDNLGFVPTMGALHLGHASLLQRAHRENEFVLLSIFVNPKQFSVNEDFSTYPRALDRDCEFAESLGVDAVFAPKLSEIYEVSEFDIIPPQSMACVLEGFIRPTHFAGVAQIVLKLLLATSAKNAYFGQKDAQQLLIIKHLVRRLFLDVNIISCPIVRDVDGLALSSRNVYLSAKQRQEALNIPQTIAFIQESCNVLENGDELSFVLESARARIKLELDYAEFIDHTLNRITHLKLGDTIFVIACRVGTTRLIDNYWF